MATLNLNLTILMALAIQRPYRLVLGRHGGVLSWKGALVTGVVAAGWRLALTGGNIRTWNPIYNLPAIRSLSFLSASFSSDTMPSSLTLPQPAPSWDHSPQDIRRLTAELIAKDRILQDKVGALKPDESNFKSVSIQSRRIRSLLLILLLLGFRTCYTNCICGDLLILLPRSLSQSPRMNLIPFLSPCLSTRMSLLRRNSAMLRTKPR